MMSFEQKLSVEDAVKRVREGIKEALERGWEEEKEMIVTLRFIKPVRHINVQLRIEAKDTPPDDGCCHQTMVLGYRCEGCPLATPSDILIPLRGRTSSTGPL